MPHVPNCQGQLLTSTKQSYACSTSSHDLICDCCCACHTACMHVTARPSHTQHTHVHKPHSKPAFFVFKFTLFSSLLSFITTHRRSLRADVARPHSPPSDLCRAKSGIFRRHSCQCREEQAQGPHHRFVVDDCKLFIFSILFHRFDLLKAPSCPPTSHSSHPTLRRPGPAGC